MSQITDKTNTIKHYWLYVLLLEQDKYYVGITSRKDPQKRIHEHLEGFYTAQWVHKYKAIRALEIINIGNLTLEQAEKLEKQRTLQYMAKYGYQNVRGSVFNYSGKYVKFFDYYFRDQDFHTLVIVIFMLLIIWLLFLQV